MKEQKASFLKTFFKNRKMIGAVSPSSPSLTKKMLSTIDFESARLIVELGPGTGVFTRKILSSMHKDCVLLAFELNDDFVQHLNDTIKDERLKIIHDSAENITKHIENTSKLPAHVDYIVSSLPLTAIPHKIRKSILQNTYEALKKNGEYIQFQYSLLQRKDLKAVYKDQNIKFTPFNIPPAFVYICKK